MELINLVTQPSLYEKEFSHHDTMSLNSQMVIATCRSTKIEHGEQNNPLQSIKRKLKRKIECKTDGDGDVMMANK